MLLKDVIDPQRHAAGKSPNADRAEKEMTAAVDDLVVSTAEIMLRSGATCVAVMDGGSTAGVVPLVDVLSAAVVTLTDEVAALQGYIDDLHAARLD